MARRMVVGLGVLVACWLAAASGACAHGKDQSPAKVLPASRSNFALHHTYLIQFHTDFTSTAGGGSQDGTIAYRDDTVFYSSYSLAGRFVGQNGVVGMLFISPDLYVHMDDGSWFVLDPWNQGGKVAVDPNQPVVDFVALTERFKGSKRLTNDVIDGKTYLHYQATIDAADLPFAQGTDGAPASSVSGGSATAEVWLDEKGFLPSKLQLKLAASDGSSTVVTYQFSGYDESATAPEPPAAARPWRDLLLPNASCTGDDFSLCLQAQTTLQPVAAASCDGPGRRVCLLPLGRIAPDLVRSLVAYYKGQYGLPVTVLTPTAIPSYLVNPLRDQVDASKLSSYMDSLYPGASSDSQAVLIGISPVDFYADDDPHLNYIFSVKGTPANPSAVMSTFRMDPLTYSEPTNDDLFFARARKFLTKYIGLLYYGLPPSSDPSSPLYDAIGGVTDLDHMREPLPAAVQP